MVVAHLQGSAFYLYVWVLHMFAWLESCSVTILLMDVDGPNVDCNSMHLSAALGQEDGLWGWLPVAVSVHQVKGGCTAAQLMPQTSNIGQRVQPRESSGIGMCSDGIGRWSRAGQQWKCCARRVSASQSCGSMAGSGGQHPQHNSRSCTPVSEVFMAVE